MCPFQVVLKPTGETEARVLAAGMYRHCAVPQWGLRPGVRGCACWVGTLPGVKPLKPQTPGPRCRPLPEVTTDLPKPLKKLHSQVE